MLALENHSHGTASNEVVHYPISDFVCGGAVRRVPALALLLSLCKNWLTTLIEVSVTLLAQPGLPSSMMLLMAVRRLAVMVAGVAGDNLVRRQRLWMGHDCVLPMNWIF